MNKPHNPENFSDLFGTLAASIQENGEAGTARRFGVAISGGLDSTCLLALLSEYVAALGNVQLYALYINHNIRPKSELRSEEASVVALCLRHGIALSIHCIAPDLLHAAHRAGSSLEEAARVWRYRAFEAWMQLLNLDGVFLAHHADDQAEQRIMRFLQGTSRDGGMSGVRGRYLRPFLSIDRTRLHDFACSREIPWHEDSSNQSLAFLRNRIRQKLIPVVSELFPGYKSALAHQAERIRTDEDFLETLAHSYMWEEFVQNGVAEMQGNLNEFAGLHAALRLRVLKRACLLLFQKGSLPALPAYRFFEPLLDADLSVPDGALQKVLREGENVQVLVRSSCLVVRPCIVEAREFGYLMVLKKPGTHFIQGVGAVSLLPAVKGEPCFGLPLVIRSLYRGELVPGRNQNLRDFLKSKGIPAQAANSMAIVEYQGNVQAVLTEKWLKKTIFFDAHASIFPQNEDMYRLEIKELEFSL